MWPIQLAFLLFIVCMILISYLALCSPLFLTQSFHFSPAPHFKILQVYLITFSTTHSYAPNVAILLAVNMNTTKYCHSKQQHFTAHKLYSSNSFFLQLQYLSFYSTFPWYWRTHSLGPCNVSCHALCPVSTVCKSNSHCAVQSCRFPYDAMILIFLYSGIGKVISVKNPSNVQFKFVYIYIYIYIYNLYIHFQGYRKLPLFRRALVLFTDGTLGYGEIFDGDRQCSLSTEFCRTVATDISPPLLPCSLRSPFSRQPKSVSSNCTIWFNTIFFSFVWSAVRPNRCSSYSIYFGLADLTALVAFRIL